MAICGIYVIVNMTTGQAYRGRSTTIEFRFECHIDSLRKRIHINPRLQRSWNKYGEEAFVFAICEECDLEDIVEREQWYLDNEIRWGWDYNINPRAESPPRFGDQSPERQEEIRKKHSDSHKGKKRPPISEEHRRRISEAIKRSGKRPPRFDELPIEVQERKRQAGRARIMSEETRRKIGEAGKGRKNPHSEETRRKMKEAWQRRGKTLPPRLEETKQRISESVKLAHQRRRDQAFLDSIYAIFGEPKPNELSLA
jgi:group I intron endonuclease